MQVLTIKRGDLDYLEIEVEKVEFYGERIIVCECRPSLEIYNAVVLGLQSGAIAAQSQSLLINLCLWKISKLFNLQSNGN